MSGNFCPRWKRDDSLESDCQAPFILCTLIAECATQRTRILGDQHDRRVVGDDADPVGAALDGQLR